YRQYAESLSKGLTPPEPDIAPVSANALETAEAVSVALDDELTHEQQPEAAVPVEVIDSRFDLTGLELAGFEIADFAAPIEQDGITEAEAEAEAEEIVLTEVAQGNYPGELSDNDDPD